MSLVLLMMPPWKSSRPILDKRDSLRALLSNRLEALRGEREGQYSIRIDR